MGPQRTGERTATVGVFDHWGWAILVTVAADATLLDRRKVELIEAGLTRYPYHHDAQRLPIAQAEALIARVASSAFRCASAALAALAAAVPSEIGAIVLRECPTLPATVAERLANYQAQNVADSVLYREALARAAAERGWAVSWYNARRVPVEAASALARESIDDLLDQTVATVGRPWTKDHRVALAAAIAFGARHG